MFFQLIIFLILTHLAFADEDTHKYDEGEEVVIWVNKVGPYHNPQETYNYYQLPFCRPERTRKRDVKHTDNSLGAIVEGNDLADSGLSLKFKVDEKDVPICSIELNPKMAKLFNLAIKQHYWYQMYIDELPVWGMVGEWVLAPEDSNKKYQALLYTHKTFTIAYHGNQVIEVNLTSENPREVVAGEKYVMTYSAEWVQTDKTFDHRFDRYLDFDFFEHQVHWFSVFNSFMLVLFLCGIVALILLKTLKNDYAKFTSEEDDLELERAMEESGWKMVHGDVFRAPPKLPLFAALIGTGYQLLILLFLTISLAFLSEAYDERGTVLTYFLAFYALTSYIAGYTSASYYKVNAGKEWKKVMVLTGCLFPLFCLAIVLFLNSVALFYQSTSSLSFDGLVRMVSIWMFISVPLLVFGTLIGRSMAKEKDFPCRITHSRRPIPDEGKWYAKPVFLIFASGILPFGSIFIEMYLIFSAIWNYKFYYVYGYMLVVYIILVIVTLCVTIVGTYLLLNSEDYRWHWTAFFSGGSTSIYVFFYAIYYYYSKTRMSGVLQASFYFGYTLILCAGLFILGGTIAIIGTNWFVRRIYQYIKSD